MGGRGGGGIGRDRLDGMVSAAGRRNQEKGWPLIYWFGDMGDCARGLVQGSGGEGEEATGSGLRWLVLGLRVRRPVASLAGRSLLRRGGNTGLGRHWKRRSIRLDVDVIGSGRLRETFHLQ